MMVQQSEEEIIKICIPSEDIARKTCEIHGCKVFFFISNAPENNTNREVIQLGSNWFYVQVFICS